MRITQGLHRSLQMNPDAVATVHGERVRSFSELADRVANFAGALRALGVQKGDSVAMLSLNSDRYLEYYLACAWLGAVVNPVNFRWSVAEINYSLNDASSVALIVDDEFVSYVDAIREGCPAVRDIIFAGDGTVPQGLLHYEALISDATPIPDQGAGGDDLFGIFYTGGTTGKPKGVMLSHQNICSSGLALLAEGAFAEGCVALHVAPMFHLADMMVTACVLIRGGRHVFAAAFRPDLVLSTVQANGVTDLLLVPAMLQALVDSPAMAENDVSSVLRIMYGASTISEAVLDRAMNRFPGVAFTQVYGMTEMSAVMTVLSPSMHSAEGRVHEKLRSGGRCAYHVEMRILNEKDEELPRNEVGEVAFRGPNMMKGYLNQEEATREALRGGWMHTGDGGYLDEDGYLFIVDRLKDMIVTGGENVYSSEVENAISQHPAVLSCAVIGVPDDEWGESVHAVVVLKADHALSQEELYTHCKGLIAGYKCPRSMEVVDALPLSGAGKVLKTELRRPYWSGRARQVN